MTPGQEACSRYPHVEPVIAYMPEPFGTHHSKMMVLLRHDDLAQYVLFAPSMSPCCLLTRRQNRHPHRQHDPLRLEEHVPGRVALSAAPAAAVHRSSGARRCRQRGEVQARSPRLPELIRTRQDRVAGPTALPVRFRGCARGAGRERAVEAESEPDRLAEGDGVGMARAEGYATSCSD